MKKWILLTLLVIVSGSSYARNFYRPSCIEIYHFLLNEMRECPEGANCVPFSANLTSLLVDVDEEGNQIYACRLSATSVTDLRISRYPATGVFRGMIDSTLRELADVELHEKYSHFVYDIREEMEGRTADFLRLQEPKITYALRAGGPSETKTIYFTHFTVNGMERPAEPEPVGGVSENERCPSCECPEGDDSPSCAECISQRLDCLEGRGVAQNLEPPAGDATTTATTDTASPASPGTRVNEREFASQENPALGGGPCQLNRNAGRKNFGLGGLLLVTLFALAGLRRNQKGV